MMKLIRRALRAHEKMQVKRAVAAAAFGQDVKQMDRMLLDRAISILPNKPIPFGLPDLDLVTCERVADNLCRIELKSGRIFYGQRSEQKQYVWHHLLKDIVPSQVSGDAYKLALDIQMRYFGSKTLPWYFPRGGTFVEGGCYTGMKAIRWHDLLEGNCRIIAVEIGRSNYDILKMNLSANGLMDKIVPVHAGLWKEDGTMTHKHNYTTRRFLERTDRWEPHFLNEEEARVVTIRTLLDEQQIETVEYFNIQVNGSEVEVLNGLRDMDRVKVFGVAAYYGKDGVRNVDVVREMALSRGCRILAESAAGRIEFVTPRFVDEIMAMQPKAKRGH